LDKRDIVVIGGGSAGFIAAQKASLLGGKVMLVEKDKLGGICVNWGCIPMCFLTQRAEFLKFTREDRNDGIDTGNVHIDFPRFINEKQRIVNSMVGAMEARLKATNVEVVNGFAKLISPDQVEIESATGTKNTVKAEKIMVAAGSISRRYQVPGAYDTGVLTARELLNLQEIPESLAIIGRSVTALELAMVWINLGCKVTIIARKPQILPGEDKELTAYIRNALESDGVRIYAGVNVESIDDSKKGKVVTISGNGQQQKVEAQYAVFALGQQPLVEGLGLENADIAVTENGIEINEKMETSKKGIYAIGDITGEIMLANVAMAQAQVAAANAMGKNSAMDYRVIPRFVRTLPPLAAVGITEDEAKEKGLNVKVGRFPFEQSVNAAILKQSKGLVKIVADSASGEILGVTIVGPHAPEMIHEAVVVMQMRGTAQDIASAIHSHPCLHEALHRAVSNLVG
jgi:dihydrolipoamide dehydrogenase